MNVVATVTASKALDEGSVPAEGTPERALCARKLADRAFDAGGATGGD